MNLKNCVKTSWQRLPHHIAMIIWKQMVMPVSEPVMEMEPVILALVADARIIFQTNRRYI